MREAFDIRVTIRDNLKKGLVFGLQARLPIGLILGFFGFRHEVLSLMQTLSHSSRAYILNAKGLKGFVPQEPIIKILMDADEKGLLDHTRKW